MKTQGIQRSKRQVFVHFSNITEAPACIPVCFMFVKCWDQGRIHVGQKTILIWEAMLFVQFVLCGVSGAPFVNTPNKVLSNDSLLVLNTMFGPYVPLKRVCEQIPRNAFQCERSCRQLCLFCIDSHHLARGNPFLGDLSLLLFDLQNLAPNHS